MMAACFSHEIELEYLNKLIVYKIPFDRYADKLSARLHWQNALKKKIN